MTSQPTARQRRRNSPFTEPSPHSATHRGGRFSRKASMPSWPRRRRTAPPTPAPTVRHHDRNRRARPRWSRPSKLQDPGVTLWRGLSPRRRRPPRKILGRGRHQPDVGGPPGVEGLAGEVVTGRRPRIQQGSSVSEMMAGATPIRASVSANVLFGPAIAISHARPGPYRRRGRGRRSPRSPVWDRPRCLATGQ